MFVLFVLLYGVRESVSLLPSSDIFLLFMQSQCRGLKLLKFPTSWCQIHLLEPRLAPLPLQLAQPHSTPTLIKREDHFISVPI